MKPAAQVRRILYRRNLLTLGGLAVIGILTAVSTAATQFSFIQGVASFPRAMTWMAANFVPTHRTLRALPAVCVKTGETVLVSIMATVIGAAISLALALLAARTTRPHPLFSAVVRVIASVCRNVPVVAWAMIFLLSFGQSVLTGLLSLLIGTVGYLTRAYAEAIDETAESSVEALHAAGASWTHTVAQAVLPSVMPQLTSWMLYMVETNVRDATLVGILTGTGIGFLFDVYYKSMNYASAALVVVAVVIVVLAIESASSALRKVML